MDRTILHCDCNGFFASVECARRPELWNVPMAVGGSEENRHGIILAKNELAKKYNIKTAETIFQARRKCPSLVVVPPHHDEYRRYSRLINKIYEKYTDRVEPFSIDESWLDVTESRRLFGDGNTIADCLREEVRESLGITISVGVSFNKIFAKIGSDYKKPDATTVISRDNFKEIVWRMPVSAMIYVGGATLERLNRANIKTIGDLAQADCVALSAMLGKHGQMLWEYANGEDREEVALAGAEKEIKSVGNSNTFAHSLVGEKELRRGVNMLADSVAERLRRAGLKCATVQIGIRDDAFKTITRQMPLGTPTYLSREIREAAMELLKKTWNMKVPVRMLSVTGINLVRADEVYTQLSLEDDAMQKKRGKQESIESTVTELKEKFGDIISFGVNKDI